MNYLSLLLSNQGSTVHSERWLKQLTLTAIASWSGTHPFQSLQIDLGSRLQCQAYFMLIVGVIVEKKKGGSEVATWLIIFIFAGILNLITLIFPRLYHMLQGRWNKGVEASDDELKGIRVVSGILLAVCVIGAIVIIATGNAG